MNKGVFLQSFVLLVALFAALALISTKHNSLICTIIFGNMAIFFSLLTLFISFIIELKDVKTRKS